MKKNSLKYVVYIFPLIYLFLGFYFRQVFGDLSLRSNDPDYIHFISGMCISTGQFDQANIDHPGSVLQLILAIFFRIIYFFRSGDLPFFEDAMLYSDLYLSVSNLGITALISLTILWAGIKTYQITSNISYSILLQTSPLLIDMWYDIIGRIYPELLMLIPILIIQVQLLKEIYKANDESSWNDILPYSFAISFGMSLKMTFLPLVLVPLIVIPSTRNKLKFIGISVLLFLVLSLPVTFQLERFWNWMKGIFLHSGSYQSGAKNIINTEVFLKNLTEIIKNEWEFFVVLILIIAGLIYQIIRRKKSESSTTFIRVSTGLLLAFAGLTFIVSKQYAIRYFLPALLFLPFLLIYVQENIVQMFNLKKIRLTLSVLILLIGIILLNKEIAYMRIVSKNIQSQMDAREKTRDIISTLEQNSYKLIASQDYGCPFHEYAIMYSFCVAGKEWPNYKQKLDKIYPNTYMYFTWDNTIKYWGKEFDPNEIIASSKPMYLYLEKYNDELYSKTIDKFFENHDQFVIKKQLIFKNSENGESILQLFVIRKDIPDIQKDINL